MSSLLDERPTALDHRCAKEVLRPAPWVIRPELHVASVIAAHRAEQLAQVSVLLCDWDRFAGEQEARATALDEAHGEGTTRALDLRAEALLIRSLLSQLRTALEAP
jgi:hypothetical protein